MEIASIVVSGLAFTLSVFTFYWTTLRRRHAFYLVRIDDFDLFMIPQFALVNGGKTDILVTSANCSFKVENGSMTPAQRLEFKESDSFLLHSGKAFHCKVTFTEPFTTSFVKAGVLEKNGSESFYMLDMLVNVSWVDSEGRDHQRSEALFRYGFEESGKMRMRGPLNKKRDLYKKHPNN